MTRRQSREEHYYIKQPKSKLHLGLICTSFRGRHFEFLTSSSVFSKRRIDLGTRLLIESMVLPEKGCILDLGCGYGPVGIAAAAFNPELHVLMIDVNDRALRLAKENAKRNNVNNVEIRRGFLYEPVGNMSFGAILCNPPVSAGMQIVLSIVADASKYLKKGGLLQLVVRSRVAGRRVLNMLEEIFGNVEVLSKKSGYRVFLSKKALK